MPPKLRFTKEIIINTGFEVVRENGWSGLSTRSLATKLGCSPIPIYSCFKSMKELETEIIKKIIILQQEYMNRKFVADPWHDHGIGYVLFAAEENLLFLGINDEAHIKESRHYGQRIWDDCLKLLADYSPFQGLSEAQVNDVQLKRWMFAHGFAFHACFAPRGRVTLEKIIPHIREGSVAILQGLMHQYKNES